jgi:hypothetical protein
LLSHAETREARSVAPSDLADVELIEIPIHASVT